MNADKKQASKIQDRTVINIHEDYEVIYWSKKFGVTPEQLKAAAQATSSDCLKMLEVYLQANKWKLQ